MTTAPATTALETLVSQLREDAAFRPLARAADSLRRAAAELGENLTQMRKQADKLQEQATTGNCYLQTTIGTSLFYDPTEYAHRAAASALAQNHASLMVHEVGELLGVDEAMLQELIAYVCANASDWKFYI